MLLKRALGYLSTNLLLAPAGNGMFRGEPAKPAAQSARTTYRYENNVAKYFAGYDGAFLLYDLSKNHYFIYNKQKSEERLAPNATFTIPHALIGLKSGEIVDEHTPFEWDGTIHGSEEWNRDQTLSSAMQNSVSWYFQRIAEAVGEQRGLYYLDSISYGNRDMSGGLTQFWLQSSLKISPREQVEFLKKFYTYQLPFSQKDIDLVKKVLVLETKRHAALSGKTGTGWVDNQVGGIAVNGWFVGYVERGRKTYMFATVIEAGQGATGEKAKDITLRILRDKWVY